MTFKVVGWPAKNLGSFTQDGAQGVTGHYTQLIWGATTKVGCGYVAWVDSNKPNTPYRQVGEHSKYTLGISFKILKKNFFKSV